MPNYQAMSEKANARFNREAIPGVIAQRGVFGPAGAFSLSAAASALGIATSAEAAILDLMPHGVQEAIRAAIFSALDRATPIPVQIAWLPGAGYEVTVCEAVAADGATNAMSIVVRTPYRLPADGRGSTP